MRGYGTYAFHTRSRVDTIDPCAVAAMFTWDDDGDGNGDGVTVLTAREGADNSRLALVARGSAMDLPGPRAANRCSRQLSSL